MKRFITSVIFTCAALMTVTAQSSVNNVPANASLVIRYSGENFSKNVPVKKLDSYNFVKNNLFKALKIDSLTSLEGTGIDFEKDVFQYVLMDDSAMSFVSLVNLKNTNQFLQLVQANYHAEMRPEKKNGYEFISMSKNTFLGWNDKQAVFVYTNYKTKYYSEYSVADTAAVPVAVADTVAAPVEDIEIAPPAVEKRPVQPKAHKQVPGKKKPAATRPSKKGAQKRSPKKHKPAPVEEEVAAEEVTEYHMSHEDSVAEARREAWYKEQEKHSAAKQLAISDSIINGVFNTKTASIETELSYKKVVDPAAHVSIWLNYDNMLNQYWATFFKGWGAITHNALSPRNFKENENKGFRTSLNIFFEKTRMRLEQKMYSPDEQIAALGKAVYNSKQSEALAGFINPDNIACISGSINTEAMANYYYKLIRQYLNSTPYINEYSDVVDVYMDLFEMIIDEKAIAELMPGNMVMVLHNMKTKKVTYTDYVYDDNFKGTEVQKTKDELSPDFTFVLETKKEGFMQKLAKLPLKYAKKDRYNYNDRGGYYELVFDSGKYALNSLYFMVKEGKAIVTTSREVIDMQLSNKGYTLDAATKNSVLGNNVYMKINSKKLVQQLSTQMSTDLSKKVSSYLEENMGDVEMTGGLKDGMMQGTTIMNITGNHTNSLEFFFNMIDAINDIMEKDKLEREKKVD